MKRAVCDQFVSADETTADGKTIGEDQADSNLSQTPDDGLAASTSPIATRPPKRLKTLTDHQSTTSGSFVDSLSKSRQKICRPQADGQPTTKTVAPLASAAISARLSDGKGDLGLLRPEVVEDNPHVEGVDGDEEEVDDDNADEEEEDEDEDEDEEDDEDDEEEEDEEDTLGEDADDVDVDAVVTRLVCPELQQERAAKKTEDRKLLALLAHFDEEQLNRFEAFRRATFSKAAVRRLVQSVSNCSISQNVVIAMAGMTKVYVGEIVEEALDYKERLGETGPLQPKHIREGFRLLSQQQNSCLSVVESPLK